MQAHAKCIHWRKSFIPPELNLFLGNLFLMGIWDVCACICVCVWIDCLLTVGYVSQSSAFTERPGWQDVGSMWSVMWDYSNLIRTGFKAKTGELRSLLSKIPHQHVGSIAGHILLFSGASSASYSLRNHSSCWVELMGAAEGKHCVDSTERTLPAKTWHCILTINSYFFHNWTWN